MFGRSRSPRPFGSCCDELRQALEEVPNPQFRVEANGVLFMVIGSIKSQEGVGLLDHAVLFCPFCGTKLQDRSAVAAAGSGGSRR